MSPESIPAIEARGLARRFGARWCLRGVSFSVSAGEVVGLTGSNGSGKTTLLRMLSTLLAPSAGSGRVLGHDIVSDADAVRQNIGFLAHTAGLYEDLTAAENLRFAASMYGIKDAGIPEVLKLVGLGTVGDSRVRGFSAGMQRRLALARLVLARPRVLLLDEPYANLDTAGIAMMNEVIRGARDRGGAALLVLHELAPAEGVLNRLETIVAGRIGSPAGVTAGLGEPVGAAT
ncbi:MAG TPA: heme ABC exporter ATP-binding protein CcmA [Gemmatimonadaceae bacterium]|nr:heme ABC exporter ATP-binding protein CcmA [Gemmatimonadaceae bacterium]